MSGASKVPSRVRGAVEGCFASVSLLAFSLQERAGLRLKRSGLSEAPAAGVFFFLRGSKARRPPGHQSSPTALRPQEPNDPPEAAAL